MSYVDTLVELSKGPLKGSFAPVSVHHDRDCPMCNAKQNMCGFREDGSGIEVGPGGEIIPHTDRCTCKPDIVVHYIQPIKAALKMERNDPCPCGSGKKFKKCCLLKVIV